MESDEGQKKALETKVASLEAALKELTSREEALQATLRDPDAGKTVKKHITQLHTYNEIRDVALGLMGKLADQERRRIVEVMARFGITKDD
ncbi:unnamed protein product [Pneumocystis jirovecii]|uniref:Swi5-domain-containing protein n=1 Tax=Pneumocystis jirovecii TaxID=42068 RepID=L0PA44_PNEJI|nr:unnamed protein product [Pneumocystis jirovecii]